MRIAWDILGAGLYLSFDPELAAWVVGIAGVIAAAWVEMRRTGVTREDLLALQVEVAEMRGALNVLMSRSSDEDEPEDLELDA